MRGFRRRCRGFTLTELMVVVGILGLVALVTGIPMLKMWKRPALEHAGNQVAGAMRLCRQKALWRRAPYRLTLDPSTSTFYSERRESTGVWVADPVDTTHVQSGVEFVSREGYLLGPGDTGSYSSLKGHRIRPPPTRRLRPGPGLD